VVVAEPLALVVQSDEEEVGALQVEQHPRAVLAVDDGVAERPGEPVEYRRLLQEVTHLARLMGEHLLHEVVDDVPVVTGEPGDEGAGILPAPD
jgi:hypothetical protein